MNYTVNNMSSHTESNGREKAYNLFKQSPIADNEILDNLELFIRRQSLSKILFMDELYKKIIYTQGVVMEFGVRWGKNLALLSSLRGIYEPYNWTRKIIGFDTFEGFPSVHEKDGKGSSIQKGGYSVSDNYQDYLNQILEYHQNESPISHIKKFELIKGDACLTVPRYLKNNPHTIISFAYFDLDIYEPTLECLKAIKNHITKGTILAFDELNNADFPGETAALKEVLGLSSYKICRSPLAPCPSYLIVD